VSVQITFSLKCVWTHLTWWKRLWMCRSCMISHFAGRFEWVHMLDTHASFDPLRRYAYTCVLWVHLFVNVLLHYVNSSSSPYLQFKENMLFLPRSIVTKKLTKPDRTLNIILFFSFRIMPSCSICTQDLRDRKALIRHGEKQCICDICSKSFYRKDELKLYLVYDLAWSVS
jgi:hypothetical protein